MGMRQWIAASITVMAIGCGARTELFTVEHDAATSLDAGDAATSVLAVRGSAALYRSAHGALFDWGASPNGEVLDGGPDGDFVVPIPVPQPVPAAGNAIQLAPMSVGNCVLNDDNSIYCWGWNGYYEIDGTGQSQPPPGKKLLDNAVTLVGNDYHCAKLKDGALQCWGYPAACEGDPTVPTYSTLPHARPDLAALDGLAIGFNYACGLEGGSVFCCGSNEGGQLGDGTTVDRIALLPANVHGEAASVAVGHNTNVCAVMTDGAVQCWGWNDSGQVGAGFTSGAQSTPVTVAGVTTAARVTIGDAHACALLADGTARCWGDNTYGQLGDGTTEQRLTPTVVVSPNGGEALGDILDIQAGGTFTCALQRSGGVWCWGNNQDGQLGDGTLIGRQFPTHVIGLAP